MNLHLTLSLALSLLFGFVVFPAGADIPNCDFYDTVALNGSHKLSNGSYLYENVVIPPQLIGSYDYELIEKGERLQVATHLRGCICKLRSCVKFCCHPSAIKVEESSECSTEMGEELKYSPLINVTLKNGTSQLMHVLDEFVVQQGIPCADGYPLIPQEEDTDNWELFENGTLFRLHDAAYLSKNEYCLTPSDVNGTYILNPINCPTVPEKSFREILNIVTMLISIPFIVVTIFIYVAIPELRNLHGKSLISYLTALALGYTMLIVMSFEDVENPYTQIQCSIFGYVCYYCFMSAFFWLSVISFDLWYSFRKCTRAGNRFFQRKQFLIFSAYAWGIPIIMTALTLMAQNSDLDEHLKPGIAATNCWIDITLWSPMIYFYGPVLILILFNITLFILTAIKIHEVQKELARITAREESSKHLYTQIDNFGLFLRLFIVMGVTWLLEVFSYMVGMDNLWSFFFWIPDICNAAQGVIIFVLFVLKRKVKMLIMKRISPKNRQYYNYSSVYRSTEPSCQNVRLCTTTSTVPKCGSISKNSEGAA